MKGFMNEFKQFIARGNVMDMAVGVIIGGAFSSITTSLINDIIMPILGIFTGSISFADMAVEVKTMNSFHKKKEEAPAEPAPAPEPSNEEKLLTEIRDLLKAGK